MEELDPDCDEKPGGSGMPACFDLCAGGFLRSIAQAGNARVAVASPDMLKCASCAVGDATMFSRLCDVKIDLVPIPKLPWLPT